MKVALAQLHAIEEGELSKKAVEKLPTINATDTEKTLVLESFDLDCFSPALKLDLNYPIVPVLQYF